MSALPPRIHTDPVPDWELPRYSPCQDPLIDSTTAKPGVEFGRRTYMERFHLDTCHRRAMTDDATFALHGFFIMLMGILQMALHCWGRGALMFLFVAFHVLAPYYFKRPRIDHGFARFLRKTFFIVFTPPGGSRPPTRLLRTSAIFSVFALSVLLLFWP